MDPTNPTSIISPQHGGSIELLTVSTVEEKAPRCGKATDEGQTLGQKLAQNEGFAAGTLGIMGVTVSPIEPSKSMGNSRK